MNLQPIKGNTPIEQAMVSICIGCGTKDRTVSMYADILGQPWSIYCRACAERLLPRKTIEQQL